MTAKNVDKRNRFRSITVGFRVSPEEQAELNRAVALSGLPKQEYCYRKCMNREVVVQPNPRVYKALKTQMDGIYEELQRIHPDVADFLIEVDGWSFRNYSKVRFIFWDERDNSVDIIYPDWQWRKAA